MHGRMVRTLAVLAALALLLGAMMAPAGAAKRKKKCKKYTPTTWGAEADTVKVTHKHTAEKPLTLEIETEMGVGFFSDDPPDPHQDNPVSMHFTNVQVDSKSKTTGLYALLEFTPIWDYDLGIRGQDGVAVAYSAGGAPWTTEFFDGSGHGGQATPGAEQVSGLTTKDCQGYLVEVRGSTTPGETVTLKLWQGEATYTPEAPAP